MLELDAAGSIISQNILSTTNFSYEDTELSTGTSREYNKTLDNKALVTIIVSTNIKGEV